jgi:hypothetical protein
MLLLGDEEYIGGSLLEYLASSLDGDSAVATPSPAALLPPPPPPPPPPGDDREESDTQPDDETE